MGESRILYSPCPNATRDCELNALAAAYRFILDRPAVKEGGQTTASDDGKKESRHVPAETILQEDP